MGFKPVQTVDLSLFAQLLGGRSLHEALRELPAFHFGCPGATRRTGTQLTRGGAGGGAYRRLLCALAWWLLVTCFVFCFFF